MTAKEICQRIAFEIDRVTPEGLGHWDLAWKIVEGPSNDFLDGLALWEEEDTERTRETLNWAATELVKAWAEAGQLYLLVEGKGAHASLSGEAVDHSGREVRVPSGNSADKSHSEPIPHPREEAHAV